MNIVWFLLIGLAAGFLANMVMKSGLGLIGDLIVGVVGAILGGYIFQSLGISAGGGLLGALIVAFIGALVLLFVIRLIKKA